MYVCICNAVSDRQIRDAVDHGARSLFEVQCQLPVGACCGRCEDTASKVVRIFPKTALNANKTYRLIIRGQPVGPVTLFFNGASILSETV